MPSPEHTLLVYLWMLKSVIQAISGDSSCIITCAIVRHVTAC